MKSSLTQKEKYGELNGGLFDGLEAEGKRRNRSRMGKVTRGRQDLF